MENALITKNVFTTKNDQLKRLVIPSSYVIVTLAVDIFVKTLIYFVHGINEEDWSTWSDNGFITYSYLTVVLGILAIGLITLSYQFFASFILLVDRIFRFLFMNHEKPLYLTNRTVHILNGYFKEGNKKDAVLKFLLVHIADLVSMVAMLFFILLISYTT